MLLPYFEVGSRVFLPYTDYNGLVTFLRSNGAQFAYIDWSLVASFPFAEAWEELYDADFVLIAESEVSDSDSRTGQRQLYRLR